MIDFEIRAVLTDIEGTTSSIDFVHKVLFPYSRQKLRPFILRNLDNSQLRAAVLEVNSDLEIAIQVLEQWIDQDKKFKQLKDIQGMIWEEGFKAAEFQGHIYEDAYEVLKLWAENGVPLYIYSSGSVQAQKLLFGYTKYGDLNSFFDGNFDTSIGPKKDPNSYLRISETIGIPPQKTLFLSDNIQELEAAEEAGFSVVLVSRDNPSDSGSEFIEITSFFDLVQ